MTSPINHQWFRTAVLLFAALAVLIGRCRAEVGTDTGILIVEHGAPRATIVVSPEAPEVVMEAVMELRVYVRKMSGATLPLSTSADTEGNLLLVGRMPAVDGLVPDLDRTDLGADGFVIRSFPGRLVITGRSDGYKTRHGDHPRVDCGTPNAVYAFLESLGIRWYMPGEDGEHVPSRTTIRVPVTNVSRRPDFDGRWIGWSTARSMGGKAYEAFHTWLVRNRTYGNAFHKGHSMSHLLPRQLFETNPEYFALVDGRRRGDAAANICTSSPEVRRVITENLLTQLSNGRSGLRGGGWRAYPVGHYDAWLWCRCDVCRAEYGDRTFTYATADESRPVGIGHGETAHPNYANGSLSLVNAVASDIAKKYPDTRITYYALYNIPGFPTIPVRPNVLPVMCHLAPNDPHWRSQVLEWEKISKHLYYYTYMGYRLDFPRLDIAESIKWCHEHKGIAMYFEHDAHTPVNSLALYLAAKATWDTDVDSKEILAAFYEHQYGKAAPMMQRFFETFDRATRGANRNYDSAYEYPKAMVRGLTDSLSGYLWIGLKQAEQPVVRRRITTLYSYWRATEHHVAAQRALSKWQKFKSRVNEEDARKALKRAIDYIDSVKAQFGMNARIALLSSEGYNPTLKEMNAWSRAQDEGGE
ncbi:MAG: hypothetical protein CMJ18_11985 [Phycisphaeraceae bacterium]|nr:hypothetical protein [Phycisphaeraceae bacterium]